MKTSSLTCAAVALLLWTAPGFADPADQPGHASPAPGTSNTTTSAIKDAAGHAAGTISAEMTSSLAGFTEAAAVSDMYEVAAGKIAEERAHGAAVKSFAKKMVEAHTKTTDELKGLVKAATPPVTPPAKLDDRRQGMIDELRGAKAEDFDNLYMSQQVDAHKEALILMRGYAKDGDNVSVKAFAARTAPVVESHLTMAQKLYKTAS